MIGLAWCDKAGRIYFDEDAEPLADGGIVRPVEREELIPAPPGAVPMILPGRRPLLRGGAAKRRYALAMMLPAGYTRLLLPAYERDAGAPALPLFGYTFACVLDDELHVAAMRTDESEDWEPRRFEQGELEAMLERRIATDPANRVLRQVALCSSEYGCFTAQNVFLERGEAALPVSPKCNARCVGCISEQEPDAGLPSPQLRIAFETSAEELARVAIHHLERVEDGIVSFGQGCEGEPLLRSITIARALELIRGARSNGTVNLNTNGSMPSALQRCIDAGLQAVRISLNSFRPDVYAKYYRPAGYDLHDVLESIRTASRAGLRVSLNLLTHPGVTDEEEEVRDMRALLDDVRVDMIQTRTLNIDPEWYFETVGRPRNPIGIRNALASIRSAGVAVGNFTHTH
ncbi:MAG TPA: radical SAM protein [Candidatus Baltobacteraceae bacterium]|nr:radical SAM protein [Candidatus Baltobacteraceae bacterium]